MITNQKKIEQILDKYKEKKFKYIEDFYKEIIYQNYNHYNISLNTICDIEKKFLYLWHDFKELNNYKNCTIGIVGNSGGLSFVGVNNNLKNKEKKTLWSFFLNYVLRGGAKLYIDIPFYQISKLGREEFEILIKQIRDIPRDKYRDTPIKLNDTLYHYDKSDSYSNLLYEHRYRDDYDLVISDIKQMLLADYFIIDLFEEIDRNSDFIDVIALKYFTREERDDRVNIYISKEIREDSHKMSKFIEIINRVILKYQEMGLRFATNSFIMPYEFDSNRRIIANTYIADSFNKSLIYLLELYRNLDIKLCEKVFEYIELKSDNYSLKESKIIAIQEYIKGVKSNKYISFEDFLFGFFDVFEEDNRFRGLLDYIQTYKMLFRF
jgi:hypothetical protein